jgi:hypothetical protein
MNILLDSDLRRFGEGGLPEVIDIYHALNAFCNNCIATHRMNAYHHYMHLPFRALVQIAIFLLAFLYFVKMIIMDLMFILVVFIDKRIQNK